MSFKKWHAESFPLFFRKNGKLFGIVEENKIYSVIPE
jgi:hypothetical protein